MLRPAVARETSESQQLQPSFEGSRSEHESPNKPHVRLGLGGRDSCLTDDSGDMTWPNRQEGGGLRFAEVLNEVVEHGESFGIGWR